MKKYLVLINTIILLLVMIFAIYKEEQFLKGNSYYLEIAPVDPRSIFQGDYMILDYVVSQKANGKLKSGFIKIKIDENKVGNFVEVSRNLPKNILESERVIKFVRNQQGLNIGANSYLFQEGKAKLYEKAKFVEIIGDKSGKLRIKNLLDKDFEVIK